MKKLIKVAAFTTLALTLFSGLQSFATPVTCQTEMHDGPVQFKFINDTEQDVTFCVQSTHIVLKPGMVQGMTYVAGTVVKHSDGTDCGEDWFTISESHHGTSLKISEVK